MKFFDAASIEEALKFKSAFLYIGIPNATFSNFDHFPFGCLQEIALFDKTTLITHSKNFY